MNDQTHDADDRDWLDRQVCDRLFWAEVVARAINRSRANRGEKPLTVDDVLRDRRDG